MFRAGLFEDIDEPMAGSVFGEKRETLTTGERKPVNRTGTS